MADQPIEIIDYDPTWAWRFQEQEVPLSALLWRCLAAPVEHVGSTAVPGLRAKPVVDILAPVHSLAAVEAVLPALEREGWLFWPDDPNRHYRMWFLRPRPQARTHHLHIMPHRHPEAEAELRFRDALRADVQLRDEYAALKQCLAGQFRDDRDAYTDAKGDFVRSVLAGLGHMGSARRSTAA